MTLEEARALLGPYADGMLDSDRAGELEAVLAKAPELQAEFKLLKEENALLTEALQPLKPSQSTRMRLSEAMVDVHRRAEEVDRALSDKKQQISRLLVALIVLGVFFIIAAALLYALIRNKMPDKKKTGAPEVEVRRQDA